MKKNFIFTLIALLMMSCNSSSTNISSPKEKKIIMGYLQNYALASNYVIPWNKITHLCVAFGRVQADGSLNISEITPYINKLQEGRRLGVKILLSIGGGNSKTMTGVLANEEYRTRLLNESIEAISTLSLDGIDVDYEEWTGGSGGSGGEIDKTKYKFLKSFCKDLRSKLNKKMLLTAAVSADYDDGTWGVYNVFDKTFHEYFDYINVMAYDRTGKWASSAVGQHASMDYFINAIDQWIRANRVPRKKIIMGVPFYGVRFKSPISPLGADEINYKDILALFPNNSDVCNLDNIGLIFYNGKLTIEQKAIYIKEQNLAGIMIWAISYDSDDESQSLLNVINQEFNNQENLYD
jgi:GH18 family chitinase